jgi:hypothetical protein
MSPVPVISTDSAIGVLTATSRSASPASLTTVMFQRGVVPAPVHRTALDVLTEGDRHRAQCERDPTWALPPVVFDTCWAVPAT